MLNCLSWNKIKFLEIHFFNVKWKISPVNWSIFDFCSSWGLLKWYSLFINWNLMLIKAIIRFQIPSKWIFCEITFHKNHILTWFKFVLKFSIWFFSWIWREFEKLGLMIFYVKSKKVQTKKVKRHSVSNCEFLEVSKASFYHFSY